MAVLGRRVAAKDQAMLVGSGASVPRLAATIYGPVPADSWVTAFGGLVGTRGGVDQDLTIGACTVDAAGLPDRWLGEAAFTIHDDIAGETGPWTPDLLDDLEVYLFSPDITGLSDNDPVATWPDSSGNGNDATQGTGAAQPSYQTNELNGHPVVRFDGAGDTMATPSIPMAEPYTVVMLHKDVSIVNGNRIWTFGADTGEMEQVTGGDIQLDSSGSPLVFTEFDLSGLTWHVTIAKMHGANTSLRFDGVASTTTGNPGTVALTNLFNLSAGSLGAQIDVAAALVFNRELTTEEAERVEGFLVHTFGLAGNLPVDHPFKSAAPQQGGRLVELRQTVSDTGLANQGIPLAAGSSVAIYCFSTDEAAVSYHPDTTAATLTRDDVSSVPAQFGEHDTIAGQALDLYCETAPNNASPVVFASALRDDQSNGSHFLTPFFNPSGHDAVWGGEPAVNFSRFDLIDEQHGDEISRVHLQVATAPDVGSLVWERVLEKGEFYEILPPSGNTVTYDLIASYIGPKLGPGTYSLRAMFADHFGAWSAWTPWLDRGGQSSKAVWVDSATHYLEATPGVAPIERIDTANPAEFRAYLGAASNEWATHAHLLVSAVEQDVPARVALSEVVELGTGPGRQLVVPWNGAWDDLEAGQQYAYRTRAITESRWEPVDLDGIALWLDASTIAGLHSGEPVASWLDRSGNGHEAVQASGAAQPLYLDEVRNGRPAVVFGGNDWLIVTGLTPAQPFAIVAVWQASGDAQRLTAWANNQGLMTTNGTDDVAIFSGSALTDFNHFTFGNPHVVSGVFNGVSSSQVEVDGQGTVTGSAGATAVSGALTIGAGAAGASSWVTGPLFEMLILDHAPSTDERTQLTGYLSHKYDLDANLPGGHPYSALAPGAELGRWYVSNAPEWQRFRTNAPPTVPVGLSPDGAEGTGEFPLLVAIASDADDTPATGFGVRFRVTDPSAGVVTVLAQLRAGTVDTWEFQTSADEIPETGTYTWDAQAFDSVATTDWSDPASFVYGDLPVVTITEPDPAEVIGGASLTVEWTTSATQAAYRVTILDAETEATVYDSGLIASAALSHMVPTDDFLHDRDYIAHVASTDPDGLVGSDEVTFHALFSLPATPANFAATPLALAGDIEPTAVELTWDASGEPDFIAYRVTRQTAQKGDDGTAERTLATIATIGTTSFIDPFPASDTPYTYRLYVIGQRGASEVASLPASDTAEIALTAVVLTGVGFGTSLRAVLRYVESADVDHTTDEVFLLPWGDTAPTAFEGTANSRVINATFALVTDAEEDAAEALTVLRELNGSLPDADVRPIICYRDDRSRKLFGTMRLREQDREIAWYGVPLVVTETNYQEGS